MKVSDIMKQYKTVLHSYDSIQVIYTGNAWLKMVWATVQNFKNDLPLSEPFKTPIHDLTFEEIGQLCGGN